MVKHRKERSPLHLHLGHHFYGAGNFGDDLMLAGFLRVLQESRQPVRVTCAIPFPLPPQQLRFPQVEWMHDEPGAREQAIAACDAWLGLGGSPFQGEADGWFLTHLSQELEFCQRLGKPMYYLGIGANEARDLTSPQTHRLLESSRHIWTREALSASILRDRIGSSRVTAGADLSHIALRHHVFGPLEPAIGFVLNFEDPAQFDEAALQGFAASFHGLERRWLVQEVRKLEGSELDLLERLPASVRSGFAIRMPAYATGSLDDLLDTWGTPGLIVTSRFHAAIVGAWMGSRVVVIERSDKLKAVAADLGLASLPALRDPVALAHAAAVARPASPLRSEALARRCCEDLLRRLINPDQ